MSRICIKVGKLLDIQNKNYRDFLYCLEIIKSEIIKCLKHNSINYKKNHLSTKTQNTLEIILQTNLLPGVIPCDNSGIYIFFEPGNPNSKNLATILKQNLKNIYLNPNNVKIISSNSYKNNTNAITIGVGYYESTEDLIWLRENIEEISKNIVMSICEYLGLPFVTSYMENMGVAVKDTSLFYRPSLNAEIIGNIASNSKVKILGTWENWYIIDNNISLGYVQTKYIII